MTPKDKRAKQVRNRRQETMVEEKTDMKKAIKHLSETYPFGAALAQLAYVYEKLAPLVFVASARERERQTRRAMKLGYGDVRPVRMALKVRGIVCSLDPTFVFDMKTKGSASSETILAKLESARSNLHKVVFEGQRASVTDIDSIEDAYVELEELVIAWTGRGAH